MNDYRVIFSTLYWVEPPPGVHSTCLRSRTAFGASGPKSFAEVLLYRSRR